MGITWGLLVLYVLIIYCLYWAHDKDGIPLLNAEQAGLWSLAVLVCIAGLSFIALVTMSYFTPLWALWGAGVFMVFRYLEATGTIAASTCSVILQGASPRGGCAQRG